MKLSEIKLGDIIALETKSVIYIAILLTVKNENNITADLFRMTTGRMCSKWNPYVMIYEKLPDVDNKNRYNASINFYYPISQVRDKKREIKSIFKAED